MDTTNRILILDYGSQFTQLIARRIREQRVYCEIHPGTLPAERVKAWNPKGIVLSGGPNSVYDPDVPLPDEKIFDLGIPILGVVENMSTHICSNCGHTEAIFGEGGGAKMCADFGAEFLGALPLKLSIREQTDSGAPKIGRAHV